MQLLFWTHFCSFQFITWFKHSACNTIHSTFFNPALKYGHVVFQQQEQRNAVEVRKKRLGIQLSVEHSTASLLVGSHGITAWHPQACAAARERKREQSTSVVDSSANKLTKPAEPPPDPFGMSYAKGTHTLSPPSRSAMLLWHTAVPAAKPRKECLLRARSIPHRNLSWKWILVTLEKQKHQVSFPKGKSCQPDSTGASLSTQVLPTE